MNPAKPDPYQPCPCGSGRKFKFCCYAKGQSISKEHPLTLIKKSLDYPVVRCLVSEDWQQQGMASIFVLRQLPNLKYVIGVYLVDVFFMGVKNAFCNANIAQAEIQRMLASAGMPLVDIDYEDARSLILGAINYARNLGMEPHEDWPDASYVVEAERSFVPKFTFGRDGKPLYIPGPDDDVNAIVKHFNHQK